MDTKMKIKEENPLSEAASQNSTEFFFKDLTHKINNEDTIRNNYCEMGSKMKVKQEDHFPDTCSQKEGCSNDCEIDTKREIQEELILPNICSAKEKETFTEDAVMEVNEHNTDSEVVTKVEIKEEPCWLETVSAEASTVEVNGVTDEDFPQTELRRMHTEAVSGISRDKSTLFSNEDKSFNVRKDSSECEKAEKSKSNESNNNENFSTERGVYLGQHSKFNEQTDNTSSCLKQNNLIQQDSAQTHEIYKKNYKCDICEKSFSWLSHLSQHCLIHKSEKPHRCGICGKGFVCLSRLKVHNLMHKSNKPHQCGICEKSFAHLSNLKLHNLIHKSKKPHRCDLCAQDFTFLSSLKRHNLIHEGIKPYKCDICYKDFTYLSSFKRHNLIHEGKKSYRCDICKKDFTFFQV